MLQQYFDSTLFPDLNRINWDSLVDLDFRFAKFIQFFRVSATYVLQVKLEILSWDTSTLSKVSKFDAVVLKICYGLQIAKTTGGFEKQNSNIQCIHLTDETIWHMLGVNSSRSSVINEICDQ